MTEQDVYRVFAKFVSGSELRLPDGSTVEVSFFTMLFSKAAPTPTYAELAVIDGGTRGYMPFFDQCQAEGILN